MAGERKFDDSDSGARNTKCEENTKTQTFCRKLRARRALASGTYLAFSCIRHLPCPFLRQKTRAETKAELALCGESLELEKEEDVEMNIR